MFGPDDSFLTTILKLLGRLPIYPMFGRGRTRLQPAYVEDVAEAIARARCRGRNRMRSHMNAPVLASTLTRNCSEPLRTKLASSRY